MALNYIGRALARYYLSLRMSAALVTPELAIRDLPNPAPIVRQLPARLKGEWDDRELIHDGERAWVIVREAAREPQSTFIWN